MLPAYLGQCAVSLVPTVLSPGSDPSLGPPVCALLPAGARGIAHAVCRSTAVGLGRLARGLAGAAQLAVALESPTDSWVALLAS
jgi:hypothetical protein